MKTKPFNLERALVGAKVVTKVGHKVLSILKHDVATTYPLSAIVELREGETTSLTFTNNGQYAVGRAHTYDLLLLDEHEFSLSECKFGDKLVTDKNSEFLFLRKITHNLFLGVNENGGLRTFEDRGKGLDEPPSGRITGFADQEKGQTK